jgi:serine/threonine protein kinase
MISLSAKNVVHRDLALRNIMVTYGNEKDRFIAKVGDMGLAMKSNETNDESALPIRWAAPECYLKRQFSSASDVWSFGIVLYELFTLGETPYKGMTNKEVIEKVSEGFRLEKPEKCPIEVYRLMKMCWESGRNRE